MDGQSDKQTDRSYILLSYISTQPFLYWIIFYSMHVRLLYANKVQFSSDGWTEFLYQIMFLKISGSTAYKSWHVFLTIN